MKIPENHLCDISTSTVKKAGLSFHCMAWTQGNNTSAGTAQMINNSPDYMLFQVTSLTCFTNNPLPLVKNSSLQFIFNYFWKKYGA